MTKILLNMLRCTVHSIEPYDRKLKEKYYTYLVYIT